MGFYMMAYNWMAFGLLSVALLIWRDNLKGLRLPTKREWLYCITYGQLAGPLTIPISCGMVYQMRRRVKREKKELTPKTEMNSLMDRKEYLKKKRAERKEHVEQGTRQ